MDAGKGVIALVSVLNSQKALKPEQILQMMGTYSTIQSLLIVGALDMARTMVLAITPDDVLVTAEDIKLILAEIDANLPGV